MRTFQFFRLNLFKSLVFILFALSTSNAIAYMKINYKTDDLVWFDEQLRYDGYTNIADFFWEEKINFDIDLIVPDFEFSGSEMIFTFEDPVIDVKASNFFNSMEITNARAEIVFFPFEESLITEFLLTFDIIDLVKPVNGTAQGGTFSALTIMNAGTPSNINRVNFDYYLDNWIYTRGGMESELSSSVQFRSENSWLTIEKISVPEPFSPALMLTGLAFMFLARVRTKTNN